MSWSVVPDVLTDNSVVYNVTDGRITFCPAGELEAARLAEALGDIDYAVDDGCEEEGWRLAEELSQARDELASERLRSLDERDTLRTEISYLRGELRGARAREDPW